MGARTGASTADGSAARAPEGMASVNSSTEATSLLGAMSMTASIGVTRADTSMRERVDSVEAPL